MSDVLVKGMKLPKSCTVVEKYTDDFGNTNIETTYVCPIQWACGVEKSTTERPKDCPLVEVKPHGRLIDADKLRGEINYLICTDCEMESCEDCDVEWCNNIIENATTVLEAST